MKKYIPKLISEAKIVFMVCTYIFLKFFSNPQLHLLNNRETEVRRFNFCNVYILFIFLNKRSRRVVGAGFKIKFNL
jgi:hypothetical protein